MSLSSENLGVCGDTHQALGLCRVIQEWNCILWGKTYWDCCLHGGLWCLFLDSCSRVAPSRALLTVLCMCEVTWSYRKVVFKWLVLFNLHCLYDTGLLRSFSSSFGLQQQVDKYYEYSQPVSLWRGVGLALRIWPKGRKKKLERKWKWIVYTEL